MDNQPPRDDDPSDMTDFEKNTASEEREEERNPAALFAAMAEFKSLRGGA